MRPMNRLQLHLADWSILAKIKIIWTEINNLKNDGKNKLNNKIFVKHNRIKINLISCTSYINVTHTHRETYKHTIQSSWEQNLCVCSNTISIAEWINWSRSSTVHTFSKDKPNINHIQFQIRRNAKMWWMLRFNCVDSAPLTQCT